MTSRGTRLRGYVNISIDEDAQPQDSHFIHSCCLDQHVAKLKQDTSSPLKNNSMFSLEIIGKTLGRSAYGSYDVIVQDDEHTRIIGQNKVWY